MLALVMAVFLGISMVGCSGKSTGPITLDGQIDVVEASIIQVAVGVAMAARPEIVRPVYDVSGKLLDHTTATATTPALLKVVLGKEIDKLNLDPLTKQSIYDLVGLIEAQIIKELGDYNINDKLVLVRQVIVIVHHTAKARIDYIDQLEKDQKLKK
jgi:hypothetical protein